MEINIENFQELDDQVQDLIAEHGVIPVLGSVKKFLEQLIDVKNISGLRLIQEHHAATKLEQIIQYLYANKITNTNSINGASESRGEISSESKEGKTPLADANREVPTFLAVDRASEAEGIYFSDPSLDPVPPISI